jgi:hypothetical protein
MSDGSASSGDAESKERDAYLARNTKAGDDVRGVAKWVLGGVTATAAGVVAGTPLTSLGALDWEPRLWLAIGAAIVGFCALGALMWHALRVITPSSYSLPEIVTRKVIPRCRLKVIENRVRGSFPDQETTLAQFTDNGTRYAREAHQSEAQDPIKQKAALYRREMPYILSSVIYENLLILFSGLKFRLLFLTPIIAASFGIFAWAASPREAKPLKPYVKQITVATDDMAGLRNSFSPPECLTQPLDVIVLGEHTTGAQDVVTTPPRVSRSGSDGSVLGHCVPVRLRLDAGRLSMQ